MFKSSQRFLSFCGGLARNQFSFHIQSFFEVRIAAMYEYLQLTAPTAKEG